MSEAEYRLDQLFMDAFETNEPAMLDWVSIKFELKKLRSAAAVAEPPTIPQHHKRREV